MPQNIYTISRFANYRMLSYYKRRKRSVIFLSTPFPPTSALGKPYETYTLIMHNIFIYNIHVRIASTNQVIITGDYSPWPEVNKEEVFFIDSVLPPGEDTLRWELKVSPPSGQLFDISAESESGAYYIFFMSFSK